MCKILCLWKTRVLQDMHFGNRKYKSRTENVASTHNITVIINKRHSNGYKTGN